MPSAHIKRTLNQCAATVLSVLEEVDEQGVTLSRRYLLARDGRGLGAPILDRATAEEAFLREMASS